MNVLQALLTEVARIRLHGFSEREVRQAQATMLSDVESAYIERDQDNSQVPNGCKSPKTLSVLFSLGSWHTPLELTGCVFHA